MAMLRSTWTSLRPRRPSRDFGGLSDRACPVDGPFERTGPQWHGELTDRREESRVLQRQGHARRELTRRGHESNYQAELVVALLAMFGVFVCWVDAGN